ncbi:MAG: sulfotransferase family protein [Acidimicrobiia bacterium]
MSELRLPNFFVIGAMKAGTSALWLSLRAHPQVYMPDVKEFHFFSNPDQLARGVAWYSQHFAAAGDARAVGEASTNYTKYPRRAGTPKNIATVIPDAKLIYVVREPISRIRSHYLHVVHRYGERRPLRDAIWSEPEYVNVSRYRMQIDQYLEQFDRSQLLVITSDALRRERANTLQQVFAFLEIELSLAATDATSDEHLSENKRVDRPLTSKFRRWRGYDLARRLAPAPVKRWGRGVAQRKVTTAVDDSVPDDLRRELVSVLRDDVAGLRPFLGPSFDGWGIA